MRIIFITLLFLLTLQFVSCYDDKGNYDYQKINDIEIDFLDYDWNPVIGDTFKLYPRFKYTLQDSSKLNLKYEWTFGERVIGDNRQLVWVVDTNVQCDLILRVTNVENGLSYIQSAAIRPTSMYTSYDSYLVLSEKQGKSILSFIQYKEKTDENGDPIEDEDGNTILDYRVIEDIYQKENKAELGEKPLFFREHIADIFPSEGHVIVFQEGGQGSVDLDGISMKKDILLQTSFSGGHYPADFHPVNAEMMDWTHLIENHDGKIYSKVKETQELFQSGFYIQTPLMFEQKEVRGHLINTSSSSGKHFTLVHEQGTATVPENRLLLVHDLQDEWDDIIISGKVVSIPEPNNAWPKNFQPLTNLGDREVLHISYSSTGGYGKEAAYNMFLKAPDGTYSYQYFEIQREYSGEGFSYIKETDAEGRESEVLKVTPLSSPVPLEECIFCTLVSTQNTYIFIAHGKNIYLFDRTSPLNGIRPYYTCKSEVVALDGQTFTGHQMMVGLSDGGLLLLNTKEAKQLMTDKEKFLWESKDVNLGKIVNLSLKLGGSVP